MSANNVYDRMLGGGMIGTAPEGCLNCVDGSFAVVWVAVIAPADDAIQYGFCRRCDEATEPPPIEYLLEAA